MGIGFKTRHSVAARDQYFPNPFMDAASLVMPTSMSQLLDLSQEVWYAAGTYRSAMERVVAYFMTDVHVGGMGGIDDELSEDEKSKWEDFLTVVIDLLSLTSEASRNFLCYGNAFISPIVPFTRLVRCPKCKLSVTHETFTSNTKYRFSWRDYAYHGHCTTCDYSGQWKIQDIPGNIEKNLKFKLWPPQQIKIVEDMYSGNKSYFWKIPQAYLRELRTGKNLETIRHAPQDLLDCAKHRLDLKFSKDGIYHMQEPALAGISSGGWGIPRTLWHFRDIYYLQLLKKFNEGIALDYLMPMRILAPPNSASREPESDPLLVQDMGEFTAYARQLVQQHRRDPGSIHTFPYPIEYQVLGGEAKQLAPHDLIAQGEDALLNSAQVFSEFYRGSFASQSAPGQLRLFEAIWYPLRHEMDAFLRWVVQTVSELLSWESVDCRLTKPRHADDLQRHMTLVQLMLSGAISRTTGLKALDLDFEDEIRASADEAAFEQEQMKRVDEEAQQAQLVDQFVQPNPLEQAAQQPPMPPGVAPMPQGMPPGGAAPAGGGVAASNGMPPAADVPRSPVEMQQDAQAMAEELLQMSYADRRNRLGQLKQQNAVLHAYVKQEMENRRSEASSQGRQAVMQQQYGAA